jgi:hypothetical protein
MSKQYWIEPAFGGVARLTWLSFWVSLLSLCYGAIR